jgi:hypothetical protein
MTVSRSSNDLQLSSAPSAPSASGESIVHQAYKAIKQNTLDLIALSREKVNSPKVASSKK